MRGSLKITFATEPNYPTASRGEGEAATFIQIVFEWWLWATLSTRRFDRLAEGQSFSQMCGRVRLKRLSNFVTGKEKKKPLVEWASLLQM